MLLNTKFTKIINEKERTAAAGIESVVSSYAIYKRSWFRDFCEPQKMSRRSLAPSRMRHTLSPSAHTAHYLTQYKLSAILAFTTAKAFSVRFCSPARTRASHAHSQAAARRGIGGGQSERTHARCRCALCEWREATAWSTRRDEEGDRADRGKESKELPPMTH